MKLHAAFIHSHIFIYSKENKAYSEGKLTYETWKRYLKNFDKLTVLGRCEQKADVTSYNISSGENVEHVKLPNVPISLKRKRLEKEVEKKIYDAVKKCDVIIVRLPSQQGIKAIKIAKKLKKPYVIELVGDIYSALWYHGNFLAKIYAPFAYYREKKVLKNAPYVLYVTEKFLQERYPSKKLRVTSACSNVEILEQGYEIDSIKKDNDIFVIGLIGSYSSIYKGIDNALNVLKKLIDSKVDAEIRILGSGNANWIIKQSKELGIENKVKLDGSLPAGTEVYKWLNNLDLYIQPSLTEGLPRALIEAMNCKLPCIASNVGGIPELLSEHNLHNPKDEIDMYNKVKRMWEDEKYRNEQGELNYETSKEYTKEKLDEKRSCFWKEVVDDIRGNLK